MREKLVKKNFKQQDNVKDFWYKIPDISKRTIKTGHRPLETASSNSSTDEGNSSI